MKKTLLCLPLCSFMLLACSNSQQSNSQQQESSAAVSTVVASQAIQSSASELVTTTASHVVATGDNAQTSLDWDGKYIAQLPCADCSGIATELTLYPDQRYEMSETYLGKDDKAFKTQGKFNFDKAGTVIQLDKTGADRQYFVAENALYALDSDGKKIEGSMAELYVLQKQN
ncbi:copper resistance protein NlpE [Acinetobacter larvae]|uniref:Copper homeostasis protein CutF n=1 Tax=Acinetobacter larvae TaxID=1789224 RepID=A0A1B2LXV8_9GAMM|nr:copper resistance protein NlpE [Acinetobacter larvae]AOA57719.1 hypothetical protein BFG52_04670 [Acinetobacter larvae]